MRKISGNYFIFLTDSSATLGKHMILSDRGIRAYIEKGWLMIEPLEKGQIRENGVDLRIGEEYARFKEVDEALDVNKSLDVSKYYEVSVMGQEGIIIKPYEHVLLHTLEYVKMPSDLVALVNLKSTLARLGLYIPPTVVDAGFEGQIVIEVIGSSFPVRLRPGTPFLHLVFVRLDSPVEKEYFLQGHYQGQRGIRLPNLPLYHFK